MKRTAFLLMVSLGLSTPLLAEDLTPADLNVKTAKPKTEQQFEEIVVTATRGEKKIDEAPGQVTVVKAKDIAKRNVKNIDESLKYVPGVYNRRGKGLFDTQAAVCLHGIPDQRRTLILMDGVVLNNAKDGTASMAGLSPEDIDHIEVVQGPASSLYGGYAMGGVVNILTRMPEKREMHFKTGWGEAWEDGESYDNYQSYYFSYGDRVLSDKFSFLLSTDRKSTDGYPTTRNVSTKAPSAGISGTDGFSITNDKSNNYPRYVIGDGGDNRWSQQAFNVKMQYDLSDETKLRLGYNRAFNNYHYGAPHSYLTDSAGNPVYSYTGVDDSTFITSSYEGEGDIELVNLNVDTVIKGAKVKFNMGSNRALSAWYTMATSGSANLFDGPGTLFDAPYQGFTSDLQVIMPMGSRQILTVGGSFKYDKANYKDYTLSNWRNANGKGTIKKSSDGRDILYGMFVQDEIAVTDKLTAFLGLRGDWWKVYDGEELPTGASGTHLEHDSRQNASYSPKLSLVYNPLHRTTVKLSGGKAFRAPTLSDLYRTSITSGVTTTSDPNLEPETVSSWDLSVKQGLWQGADIQVGYFENYLKDTISIITVNDNLKYRANIGKAQTKGFTVEINQQLDDWLRIYANTTYLTQNKVTHYRADESICGSHLQHQPMRMANAGIETEYKDLTSSLNWRYVSQRYATDDNSDRGGNVYGVYSAYSLVDAKFSYAVKENASVSVSIDNLFDRQYYDYYKTPGRTWYVELGLKF